MVVTMSACAAEEVRTTNSVTVENTPWTGTAEKVTSESRSKTTAYELEVEPTIGVATEVPDLLL